LVSHEHGKQTIAIECSGLVSSVQIGRAHV
jgi:hypothetical protein